MQDSFAAIVMTAVNANRRSLFGVRDEWYCWITLKAFFQI